jgi:hypothetical protein
MYRPEQGQAPRWCRLMAAGAALALLLGCQPQGPDAPYNKYLSRLGRTLAVDVLAPEQVSLARPPRPGKLRLAITPGNLGALDFLTLSGCAVQVTIGKRNSSLGRMARDSQRLLLELEYLQLAPECISYQRTQGRSALADTLQQAWLLKQQQLPALIFNATLGGAEYRAFWRAPPSQRDYPDNAGSQPTSALHAINHQVQAWLDGDYRAENQAFEILLSEVAAGDGGALTQAMTAQGAWLDAANRMLAQRIVQGPLCAAGFRAAAADILPNVIRKYFIGDIQPRATALGRRYHELVPTINTLEAQLAGSLPANYRHWQKARNDHLASMQAAPRQHVEQLQDIQRPCLQ